MQPYHVAVGSHHNVLGRPVDQRPSPNGLMSFGPISAPCIFLPTVWAALQINSINKLKPEPIGRRKVILSADRVKKVRRTTSDPHPVKFAVMTRART
jgi:hypothetical protein